MRQHKYCAANCDFTAGLKTTTTITITRSNKSISLLQKPVLSDVKPWD